MPMALQSRLLALAQTHQAGLVCLTEKAAEAPSLSPLVGLRVEPWREALGGRRFVARLRGLKDKRRGPTWEDEVICEI